MLSATPVLVTGAAGFVGYHVCDRLVREGVPVIGIDNFDPYYSVALKESRWRLLEGRTGVTLMRADICDRSVLEGAFDEHGPRTVIHLAAQVGVRYGAINPHIYADSNVVGFLNVLENCRRVGNIDHLVYASSSSVYGSNSKLPFSVKDPVDHPVSLYAATKRAGELMAHSYSHLYGLRTTGLRFFTVYGPWGRPDMSYFTFADAILTGRELPVHGDGEALRDFTYVDDIVEGALRVAARPPVGGDGSGDGGPSTSAAPFRLFNIGHGSQITVNRLIDLLERLFDKPAKRVHGDPVPGDLRATHAEVNDLATHIDFTPQFGIEEGMIRFATWFTEWHEGSA